eukprot:601618_1
MTVIIKSCTSVLLFALRSKSHSHRRLFGSLSKIQRFHELKTPTHSFTKKSNIESHAMNKIDIIHHQLTTCKQCDDIISILEKHQESIAQSSPYIQAMKMYRTLSKKDPQSIRRILCLFLDSNIQPTVYEFNTFFNSVLDSPNLCAKYFKEMTNKYELVPDIVTFNALIKGCSTQRKHRTAGKYWYLMKHTYAIQPDNATYKEMIRVYAKSEKTERAEKIFNEYLEKVRNKELKPLANVFRAYLNVFSLVGDIKGMKHAFKVLQQHGMKVNAAIIGDVMSGYLIGGHPDKSIQTLRTYIASGGCPKTCMLLDRKCNALTQMIQNESVDHVEEKQALYAELQNTIHVECKQYHTWIPNHVKARCLLASAIALYGDDTMRIVEVFESLKDQGSISDMVYVEEMQTFAINLHLLNDMTCAKFMLFYCITFKWKELVSVNDYFAIVVGKGLHSKRENKKKGKFGEFIANELLAYTPPIKCINQTQDKGILIVNKQDLLTYINEQKGV